MTNGGFDLGHFCWLICEQKNFFGRIKFQCLRNSGGYSEGLEGFGKFWESILIKSNSL